MEITIEMLIKDIEALEHKCVFDIDADNCNRQTLIEIAHEGCNAYELASEAKNYLKELIKGKTKVSECINYKNKRQKMNKEELKEKVVERVNDLIESWWWEDQDSLAYMYGIQEDQVEDFLAMIKEVDVSIKKPEFSLLPVKSLTLGKDLVGKITEKEAVDLVNAVVNAQISLSNGDYELMEEIDSHLEKRATEEFLEPKDVK